jgi:hypothetical protein
LDKGLIYRIHKELKNGTQKINNLINKGTNWTVFQGSTNTY